MIHAAADLRHLVAERPATLYWTMDPDVRGVFVAHDLASTWVFMHGLGPEPRRTFDDYTAERVRRAVPGGRRHRRPRPGHRARPAVAHVVPDRRAVSATDGCSWWATPPTGSRPPADWASTPGSPMRTTWCGSWPPRRAGVGTRRAARLLRRRAAAGGRAQRRQEPRERAADDRRLRGLRGRRSDGGVAGGRSTPRSPPRRDGPPSPRPPRARTSTSTCSACSSASPTTRPTVRCWTTGTRRSRWATRCASTPRRPDPAAACPHAWVARDGARVSTLDLVPPDRFVLLTGLGGMGRRRRDGLVGGPVSARRGAASAPTCRTRTARGTRSRASRAAVPCWCVPTSTSPGAAPAADADPAEHAGGGAGRPASRA